MPVAVYALHCGAIWSVHLARFQQMANQNQYKQSDEQDTG